MVKWKWADKKVKKLTWIDVQFIKLSMIFFAIFVISLLSMELIEKIIELRWLWLVLFVVFAIKPLIKIFKK